MNYINKVSKESLIIGLVIEEVDKIVSTEEKFNEWYEEYDQFVGELLNTFYEYVLQHPNQDKISLNLKLY